jgi:hypothetical protein
MKIEKSISIGRSPATVFDYLKYTRNQDNFNVWNMTDPGMKKEYKGTDGTIGFVYGWDSTKKNVGAGEQETTGMEEGKRIEYALRFFRPMQNTGISAFEISSPGEGTSLVRWIFESPSKFPMSLFSPIFKILLGKDLEKGLGNLKVILEKN